MANFQKIVLTIAIVFLIICLIVIGFILARSKNDEVWPPVNSACPDYWLDTSTSGDGSQCINSKDLGTCPPINPGPLGHSNMNFTAAPFVGSNGTCAKYKWANQCGLTWDGITYGNSGDPCETPAPDTSS